MASKTNTHTLQTIQNSALRVATGCTADTNTQHLHEETLVLPLSEHINLLSSQLKLKSKHPKHPLHSLITQQKPARHLKQTIFHEQNSDILNIDSDLDI